MKLVLNIKLFFIRLFEIAPSKNKFSKNINLTAILHQTHQKNKKNHLNYHEYA